MKKTTMTSLTPTVLARIILLALTISSLFSSASSASSEDDLLYPVPEEVITVADTPGELWVSRNSSHCNWKRTMGPLCVYNDTNEVVVVPAGFTLPLGQLEVEIHSAKTLHVYPTCISWIQVYSAGLVTTLPSEEDFYSMYRKRCRTWLRIYDSRADSISHGVKDLTIINSEVNTINLIEQRDFLAINSSIQAIEALSWEGYRGTFRNTTVQRVSGIIANDNWIILGSHIEFVTSNGILFRGKEMAVTNSSIAHIATRGFTVDSGTVTISNVTIGMLDTSGIVMDNHFAFLALVNVTILSAFPHCIVLPDREKISFENVTIGGTPLDNSSPYFRFTDDFVAPDKASKVQVESDREGCSTTPNTLTCDFNSVNESIEMNASNIKGYQIVQIKNVKSLQVLSTSCNSELQLRSVNGSLPHLVTETKPTGLNATRVLEVIPETCNMSLLVEDSRMDVIFGRHITNMTITNTTVKTLHDGILGTFRLTNVSVATLDSVNVTGQSQWSRLVVGSISNVILQAPVNADVIVVSQPLRGGALIIDHPNETSEMSHIKFHMMDKSSLVVKRGKLILRDMVAIAMAEGAIYVEEGATIELHNMMQFIASYRSISVATRDQVLLNGTRDSSGFMLHLRNPPPAPDMNSNFTISAVHLSPYCTSVPFVFKVCDFSQVINASVVVDLIDIQQSPRAVVCGASFVTLYPSCIEKLILLRVDRATTVDNENDCETWLEAKGVKFQNITSGVHDVTLTSCTVELLSPNRKLRDLDLENTRVEWIAGVQWSGYTGLFNNSYLVKVQGMVASSRMVMSNTTVEKILPNGIRVQKEGVIASSTIKEIATGGIKVESILRLKDVTIGSLAERAIVVTEGVLFLTNVTIEQSAELSIVAMQNGAVAMQNVTVAGKSVYWRGYSVDNLEPNHPSLVFVNKPLEDDHTNIPTIPDLTAEEVSKSTPQSSSMTKAQMPEDNGKSTIGPTHILNSKKIDKSSSLEWAGISVGIFLVLLLGCCVILTVKLVKPNNGRMLPIIFWRVKDDQNDLLADDQTSLDINEPSRNSGYHPLPGSEVI